jgi:hypothetical protein
MQPVQKRVMWIQERKRSQHKRRDGVVCDASPFISALELQEMTIFRRDRFGAICVDATSQKEETKFQSRPAVFASLTCGLLGFLSSPSSLLPNIIKQGHFQSANSI